jgi:hypothetical protein
MHYCVLRDDQSATFSDALDALRNDLSFRSFFLSLLTASDLTAFRWETSPITRATIGRPFEFVLLPGPGLDRPAEPQAFAEHIAGVGLGRSVVSFANLRNDAMLVVPVPMAPHDVYVHLATFVRGAPIEQQHELLRTIGTEAETRLSDLPLWISTAGLGVAWLHVRLDSTPEYYGHDPYRRV